MKTVDEYLELLPGTIMFPEFNRRVLLLNDPRDAIDIPKEKWDDMIWSDEKLEYRLVIEKTKDDKLCVSYKGVEYNWKLPLYQDQIEEMQRKKERTFEGGIYRDDFNLQVALHDLWEWVKENNL